MGAFLIYSWRNMSRPKILRVGYPLSFIQQGQKLLDPANTDSVYQFYLLENLAVGMVRDSSQSPSGYEPGLAQSWERLSPTRWAFDLKPNLAWSDGTPIEPQAIADHIESLGRREHRHIVYLKRLRHATVEDRRIILDFDVPTNDGLIHELGLADAALLHPGNLADDWRIVSGAYSVEFFDPGKKIILRRNPHYPGSHDYPEQVELDDYTMGTIANFFKSDDIDLLKIPAPAFRGPNQEVLSHAPQVLKGYPTWIYYLYFNPQKPLWRDLQERKEFSLIVDQALAGFTFSDLVRERQLIPEGYSGHLDAAPTAIGPLTGRLAGKRLKVNLLPAFSDAESLCEALKAGFAKAGVSLDFNYSWNLNPAGDDADVQLSQFSGNQSDAMGSWQFMFSPEHGDLAPFRSDVAPFFSRIMATETKEARESSLRDLHRHVLGEAYAVPLFIEADQIAASKRIDLSHLNPFDMRLRFYEVRWK